MSTAVRHLWTGFVQPLLQRPKRVQLAALCYRGTGADKQVLMITSRGTGRWIIPKGWPMAGKSSAETVLQEAWEEAGVRGRAEAEPVGSYSYDKGLSSGWSVSVETTVYAVEVEELSDDFPEAHQRRRKWVSPAEAAGMVKEPELQELLANF